MKIYRKHTEAQTKIKRQAVAARGQECHIGGRSLRDWAREGGEEAGTKIERICFDGRKMGGDRGKFRGEGEMEQMNPKNGRRKCGSD